MCFALRQCAELFYLAMTTWETQRLDKAVPLVEELLRKGLTDADGTTRKHIRRYIYACNNVIRHGLT